MATDSILGLFTSPQQYQQELQNQALAQGAQLARLSPLEAGRAMGYAGAAQLGRGLAGVMGAEDPMLQMASRRQAIMQQVDQTDPNSLAQAAQALNQAGDVQGARALYQAAQQRQAALVEQDVKQSQIVKNLREGNAAMLTSDQRNFAQARQEGYKGTFNQWLAEQNRSKGTNISLGLSTVDKESNLRKDFTTETKPITTVITTADRIDKLLTSNTSLGEVIARKQFAKLAGDTNISNRDVADLANFGDLGQRLSGILSGFFEGKYSEAQRQEALNLVKQLKSEGTNQYSTIQNQYRERAAAENIPEKTSKFIAPDLPAAQKVNLPPEGTRLRNKKTGKIEVVQGGKLVPVSE